MTTYEKKVFFWVSIGLLISLAFIFGFALGETAWVLRIKASIFETIGW